MRKIILVSALSAWAVMTMAQIPQGINYQAVAHTSAGAPIMNTTIQVKAAILSDTLAPVIIWEELHPTVKTNASGVFNLVVGTGNKESGTASAFNSIDWSKTPLYLKIQIYYQSVWKYMGTSKLWSVPFALASGGNTDVTGIQTEINAVETGAGLNTDGSYSANASSNYLSSATSLKNADDLLDAKVKTTEGNISANSTEINTVETGAGLSNDGSYSANTSSNYLSAATSLKNADDLLDAKIKTTEGNISANSTEINTVETGAGLNTDGSYSANTSSNYLSAATSLKNADDLLDAKVKTNEGNISTNSTEINTIETGTGLNDNGTYSANAAANYISAATSLKDADNKLDAQVKVNSGKIAENSTKMQIKGVETSPDSALFRVVNRNGQTVFAVFNEGVRIYVDDGAKGKGGFSVGGFGAEKAPSQNLLYVSTDSIRAYVDKDTGKGAKGGFAIGGFGALKAASQNLFVVSHDSIRAYIDTVSVKGAKGGFAIGGFSSAKGLSQELLVVNADSIRAYIDTNTGKGAKGGFAIGGFNSTKTTTQDLLFVNADSIRAYIDKDLGKGAKGGFAIGGFNSGKAPSQNLLIVNHDSIRAYIDTETVKGAKGGFAIGGFNSLKTTTQDLLFVNADSIRAYIDTNTEKGAKGGFAIGGFETGKATREEYLRVTRDSTRVYLNDTGTKGAKGGFAIGGFGGAKALPDNYMLINPDSTRFYVRQVSPDSSTTFNIIGINLDQTQTSLLSANTDTVGIGTVLTVQNNLNVTGNIGYTGSVSLVVPELTTLAPFNITNTTAMVTGEIISDGGTVVIVSGVCWSTSPNPTDKLVTKTTDGTLTSQFTSTITGLAEGTTYYVRAYATNANGTGYGNEVIFVTAGGSVADIDGNIYDIITIGTQNWMGQNLKTTRLNNGVVISNVADSATWVNLLTPGYVWYLNDAVTYADYGILYNWTTVNTGLLCPTGWHVPSEADWTILTTFLGGSFTAGSKLKETGTTHWLPPNSDATNEVGFTALPGGKRGFMGPFNGIGDSGNFWTSSRPSTDPLSASIYSISGELMLMMTMERSGLSVRCVQD